MEVDSFKYLSRLVSRYYKLAQVTTEYPLPWTSFTKQLENARFGLVTSGGLYHRGRQSPFDLEGERRDPTWGDPSYRTLSVEMEPLEVGVSHHHLNASLIEQDINVLLPIQRFRKLVQDGRIGSLAPRAYSFMGYQGFPADLSTWKESSGPAVAEKLLADGVDCVLLTAA